jgi:hypothetical protein
MIICVFTFHLTKGSEVALSEITNVTKIIVRKGDSDWLAVKWITETQQVQKIVAFIMQQREGWDQPSFATASMGSVVLDLYNGKDCLASFGIGENFFGAEHNAKVRWKNATEKQKRELLLLIGDLPATLKDVTLPKVLRVTRILVLTNGVVAPDKTITNLEQLGKIAKFINQQCKGWDKPKAWADKPAPFIQLELQDNDEFVREFWIGKDFFETLNYESDIIPRYKKATMEQRENILKLIDSPKKNP